MPRPPRKNSPRNRGAPPSGPVDSSDLDDDDPESIPITPRSIGPIVASARTDQTEAAALEMKARGWPTIAEAEVQTGIPMSSLRRWASQGKIKAVVVDRAYRVDPAEILELAVSEENRSHSLSRLSDFEAAVPGAPPQDAKMVAAIVEVMGATAVHVRQMQGHQADLLGITLKTLPSLNKGFEMQIGSLNDALEQSYQENARLRGELRAIWEKEREGITKNAELEIKKKNAEEAWSLGKLLGPQLLTFIAARFAPADSSTSDRGIAAWLSTVTEPQARALLEQGLITPQQGMDALGFRETASKGQPLAAGVLTRWLRTFTGEQLAKIVAAGVLDKGQNVALVAAHEAAGKVDAAALAAGAAGVAPPPQFTATPPAAAPAAAGAAGAAPPAGGVMLSPAQATAVREIVRAMVELSDDEITHKGEKTDVLTMIGSRMTAESRRALKSLDLR